jgi:hypothetical protein
MPKSGMEAVASKQQDMQSQLKEKLKRKPVMQRKGKGPGVAVMIAIGKPKGPMGEKMGEEKSMREELDASKGEGMSKADKIAALEEKIGYLKAELALLRDEEDEMDEEMDDEGESEDESDDEDEYDD